jgi:hypothetical protein
LAALFVCLPGPLRARSESGNAFPDSGSRAYTVHLSGIKPPAKIELSVTPASAEWEVTAAYDSALCEIHCVWRRRRDAFGRTPATSSMLPPIASIRVFTDFVSPPATRIVNPAGLGLPETTKNIPVTQEAIFVLARRLFITAPARLYDSGASNLPRAHFFSRTSQAAGAHAAALPLRI